MDAASKYCVQIFLKNRTSLLNEVSILSLKEQSYSVSQNYTSESHKQNGQLCYTIFWDVFSPVFTWKIIYIRSSSVLCTLLQYVASCLKK